MRFVDSHCHLDRIDLEKEKIDFGTLFENAQANNVEHMLCVAISLDQFPAMVEKSKNYKNVSFSCGVHPLHVGEDKNFTLKDLHELASDQRVVAVGETGLDYYYSKDSIADQQKAFAHHIEVGNKLNKPIIVHTRDAREDTIAILKEQNADKCRGVLHCFTESWEMAKQAMDLNFYISISGIVTFKSAAELQDVVRKMPLDRLLIETDSPYLAPVPYRGKQNQPAYVKHVAEFVAQLKNISVEEVAEQTTQNFKDLFTTAKL
ncbi:YchF/TatD family DNA exonuclease [Psychrosphaera haliotis]|uniref:TatD family hydrolase n=1 Tax=Psychrosphaera haliotis TaxID=555083 RepID=UPI0031E31171